MKLCASGQDASGQEHLYHEKVDKVLEEAFNKMCRLLVSKVGHHCKCCAALFALMSQVHSNVKARYLNDLQSKGSIIIISNLYRSYLNCNLYCDVY